MAIDKNTLVLLHLDDNLDNSGSKQVTFTKDYGNATFSDTAKFGKASLYFKGASIACQYGGSNGLTLGDQFTVDFWAKLPKSYGASTFFVIGTSYSDYTALIYCNSNSDWKLGGPDNTSSPSAGINVNDEQWHHYAFVRMDGVSNFYFDGKKKISYKHAFKPGSNYKIRFGGSVGWSNEYWMTGYLDEIRISDCARWTSNFTPPTVPYGDGGAGQMNFDNVFPYSEIKEVTIDGQAMIWYPKTYVRALDLPDGQYKGKYAWQISEYPLEGFHVHRAFIDSNGKERDGFYLGKYEASNQNGLPGSVNGAMPWVNIDTPTAIAACKKRNTDASNDAKTGWHIENCFEYWYVSLLMLIDLGNADTYTAIGAGGQGSLQKCGSTNAVWRGLYEHWANAWEIVDGCKMDGNGIVQIWDTTGETYVSTGKKLADSGIARGSGTGYDLSDTFIPAADGKGSSFSATTSDVVRTGSNTFTYLGGGWGNGSSDGAFAFDGTNDASGSYGTVGFRLAKY